MKKLFNIDNDVSEIHNLNTKKFDYRSLLKRNRFILM